MYAAVVFSFLLLIWLMFWRRLGGKCFLKAPGPVLLITAHPDDECMFFAPTILALTRRAPDSVYLLCLSEGNCYGRGPVRKQELYKSAAILGIRPDHTIVIDDARLPDCPDIQWSPGVIMQHIFTAIKQHGIQTIITFDQGGVSGHPNHTAVCTAVREMRCKPKYSHVGVLLLESVSLCRKYAGLLDLPLSAASYHYAVGTLSDYFKARRAMQAHWSQYVWFRRLYICFSRYMIVNTFRKLQT